MSRDHGIHFVQLRCEMSQKRTPFDYGCCPFPHMMNVHCQSDVMLARTSCLYLWSSPLCTASSLRLVGDIPCGLARVILTGQFSFIWSLGFPCEEPPPCAAARRERRKAEFRTSSVTISGMVQRTFTVSFVSSFKYLDHPFLKEKPVSVEHPFE